jgi:hypothetical protein
MSGPDEPQYPEPQDPQYPGPQPQHYPAQPPYQPYPTQGYPAPGYPPGGYPPPDPGYPVPAPRARLVDRFADRLAERPAPRVGVSLAGAGVALVIVGVIVWGGTYVVEGSVFGSDGARSTSRHYLGAVLALVVVAIGYALAIGTRRGALATAGVAASGLGVPVALEFLTLDVTGSGGSVLNSDAVVWGSVVVWLASYLWVRGAQGHSFYLALTLYALWIYLSDKAAPSALASGAAAGNSTFGDGADFGGPSPAFSTLAGVSLTIGAVYYLIAWGLDRSGRRGAAVSFVVVGFFAVAAGIAALTPDLKQVGTGIVLIVVGVGIAMYGARYGRRFTTWVWAAGAALGGALIIVKLVADQGGAAIGISLVVVGAIFITGGALLARLIQEPDDVVTAAEVA